MVVDEEPEGSFVSRDFFEHGKRNHWHPQDFFRPQTVLRENIVEEEKGAYNGFCVDGWDSKPGASVRNRILTLKSSYKLLFQRAGVGGTIFQEGIVESDIRFGFFWGVGGELVCLTRLPDKRRLVLPIILEQEVDHPMT